MSLFYIRSCQNHSSTTLPRPIYLISTWMYSLRWFKSLSFHLATNARLLILRLKLHSMLSAMMEWLEEYPSDRGHEIPHTAWDALKLCQTFTKLIITSHVHFD